MANLLRHWIAAAIERELDKAAQWIDAGQAIDDSKYSCSSHELGVRVNTKKIVQVIEIHNQNAGFIEATLSDGVAHIEAQFESDCIKIFTRHHRSSFREGAKGGLLQMTTYDLVIRSSSPGLLFRIGDFKFIGSEKSATIGRPVDIEAMPDITAKVKRVASVLKSPSHGTKPTHPDQGRENTESLIKKHLGSISSQPEFATQLPLAIDAAYQPNRPVQTVNKCNKPDTSAAAMLSILAAKTKNPILLPKNTEQGMVKLLSDAMFSNDNSPSDGLVETGSTSLPVPGVEPNFNVALPTVSYSSQGSLKEPSNDLGATEPELTSTSEANPSESEKNHLEAHPGGILGHAKTDIDSRMVDRGKLTSQAEDSSQEIIELIYNGPSFTNLKRVPRKYVHITKEQQNLLARDDSWVVDNSRTFFNVPGEVLKTTSSFVDEMAVRRNHADGIKVITGQSHITQTRIEPDESDSDTGSECESANKTMSLEHSLRSSLTNGRQETTFHTNNIMSPQTELKITSHGEEMGTMELQEEEREDEADSDADLCTEDDDAMSWSASPSPNPRIAPALAVKEDDTMGDIKEPISSLSDVGHQIRMKVRKDPQKKSHGSSPILPNSSRPYKRANSPILLSSLSVPSDDEEMELGIPYAIGDMIEESDEELGDELESAVEIPSTLPSGNTIQVERTPHPLSSISKHRWSEGGKRGPENDPNGSQLFSSQIIPATCIDQSPLLHNPISTPNTVMPLDKHSLRTTSGAPSLDNKEIVSDISRQTDSAMPGDVIFNVESAKVSGASLVSTTLPDQSTADGKSASENISRKRKRKRVVYNGNSDQAESEIENEVRLKAAEENMRQRKLFLDTIRSKESAPETSIPSNVSTNLPKSSFTNGAKTFNSDLHLHNPSSANRTNSENEGQATKNPDGISSSGACLKDDDKNQSTLGEMEEDAALENLSGPPSIPNTGNKGHSHDDDDQEELVLEDSIFSTFRTTYPDFGGSLRYFIRICVYIYFLQSHRNQLHPCLWDDFMRCMCTEFPAYIKNTKGLHQHVKTGIEYYNTEVEVPLYSKRILRPINIKDGMALNRAFSKSIWNKFVDQGRNDRQKPTHLQLSGSDSHSDSEMPTSSTSVDTQNSKKSLPSGKESPKVQSPQEGDSLILTALENEISESDSDPDSNVSAPANCSNPEGSHVLLPPQEVSSDDKSLAVSVSKANLKRPYFQTHSQVAKRDEVLSVGHIIDLSDDKELQKKRRSLPWVDTKNSQVMVPLDRNGSHSSSPSFTIPRSSTRRQAIQSVDQSQLGSRNGVHHRLGSPVLDSEIRADILLRESRTITAVNQNADDHRSSESRSVHSLPNRKSASASHSNNVTPSSVERLVRNDSKKKSQPGKEMGPPPKAPRKFCSTEDLLSSGLGTAFVPRRKRLSGISSSMCTPSSTPMTPARKKLLVPNVDIEPETQAWGV